MDWSDCECVQVNLIGGDDLTLVPLFLFELLVKTDFHEPILQILVLAGVLKVSFKVFPLNECFN